MPTDDDRTILGLDPGTARTGYGLLRIAGGDLQALAWGVITTPARTPLPDRLLMLHDKLSSLLAEHPPDAAAVEKLFFSKNVTTGISVSHARGVMLLALAQAGLSVAEYTPNEVKQALTGYGAADKHQMQMMVRNVLGLDETPRPDDAADALAVALCHHFISRFNSRIPLT